MKTPLRSKKEKEQLQQYHHYKMLVRSLRRDRVEKISNKKTDNNIPKKSRSESSGV